MKRRFNVTYDVVTPESAEQGDCAERGFLDSYSFHVCMDGIHGADAAKAKSDCAMSLREAVNLIGCLDSWYGSTSFYEADGSSNYRTGETEFRALHCPDTITASSLARVARLLGVGGGGVPLRA